MTRTIVIVGFGPGISTAVAERFGAEGFSLALIARNADRLAAGVAALKAAGLTVAGFAADAADPGAIRAAIGKARAELGAITALHWNAFSRDAGDLLAAAPAALSAVFDVPVVGLLGALQEALPDLKAAKDGALLVTNGAYGELNPQIDAMAVNHAVMGLALGNGAKHKLVGLLAQALKDDGVYVGEVMVAGGVKGTPWGGDAGIEPSAIADQFWSLYQARDAVYARIG